jgi:hypothetical protein
MNGSVPSRWSRLIRVLRPTAVVVALLFVIQACGSNPKPDNAPQPKPGDRADATPAKPAPAPTPTPAPAPAPTPAPAPAPAPTPAPPAAPVVKDTAAIRAAFCKQVMTDVLAIIKDTTNTTIEPDSVIRKVVTGLPDTLTSVAMAKGERCQR